MPWGLKIWTKGEIAGNAHMGIKSCLNGKAALIGTVDLFVIRNVRFVPCTVSLKERVEFWNELDVPNSILTAVAEVDPWMDPEDKVINVSDEMQKYPDCMDKVTTVLIVCRRLLDWPNTRWARSGKGGRLFLRSEGTGLKQHVDMILHD